MRPDYSWERPRKVIAHREPSAAATCSRVLEEFTDRDGTRKAWRCSATLKLHITQSPIPEYETLVTQTCLAGHIQRVQGVLRFQPEVWADDGENDTDATSYGV